MSMEVKMIVALSEDSHMLAEGGSVQPATMNHPPLCTYMIPNSNLSLSNVLDMGSVLGREAGTHPGWKTSPLQGTMHTLLCRRNLENPGKTQATTCTEMPPEPSVKPRTLELREGNVTRSAIMLTTSAGYILSMFYLLL